MAFALVALVSFAAFCRYSIIMTFAAGSPGALQGQDVLPEALRALSIAGVTAGAAAAILLFWQAKRIVPLARNFQRREPAVVFPPATRLS